MLKTIFGDCINQLHECLASPLTKHVSEETTNKKYTYNLIDVPQGNVYYEKPKNTDNIQIYR